MTSIVNGLAALVAIATVTFGGLQVAPAKHLASHNSIPVKSSPSYQDPVGTDAYTWAHAHNNRAWFPPPPPPPPPAPVAEPVAQPLAQGGGVYIAPAAAPRPAPPPLTIGSTQQAMINSDRAGAGLGALNWSSCLAGIAYQSALRMANQGFISHAGGAGQDLGCGLGSQGGENVGYWSGGISDGQLNTMFMNSPEHRANIMGPYHYVGTAWVVARNGFAYLAVEFS